jgi:hypothetical protein
LFVAHKAMEPIKRVPSVEAGLAQSGRAKLL